ncbi:hypothetical protein ACFZDG_35590 [Kitasatospora xanthocidica]|uniref:hypothetical protein n=1 Tax=Kitasatospora xanthocidica TaxID=83382 RepID=UPI0036E9B5E5
MRKLAQLPADAVCPMVSAAVFGRILGDAHWETKVRAYVHGLYGIDTRAPVAKATVPTQREGRIERQETDQMELFSLT